MEERKKDRAAYAAYAKASACLEAGGQLLKEAGRLGREALCLCAGGELREEIEELLKKLRDFGV